MIKNYTIGVSVGILVMLAIGDIAQEFDRYIIVACCALFSYQMVSVAWNGEEKSRHS
jgi:hypothetical protein